MKKIIGKNIFVWVLLFLFSICISAQSKPNFSGNWTIDKTKSKLEAGETLVIKSMTIKVIQTDNNLIVEPLTEFEPAGGGRGTNMLTVVHLDNRRKFVYKLDGSETADEFDNYGKKSSLKFKAGFDPENRLILTKSYLFDTIDNTKSIVTKEFWELFDGGQTLGIIRNRNGEFSPLTMYFTKINSNHTSKPLKRRRNQ